MKHTLNQVASLPDVIFNSVTRAFKAHFNNPPFIWSVPYSFIFVTNLGVNIRTPFTSEDTEAERVMGTHSTSMQQMLVSLLLPSGAVTGVRQVS